MEEELLVALEKAYAQGASFDDISAALSKQGMDDKIYIVENFYKKKKEPGTEQSLSGLGVSPSASTSQATQGSAQPIAPLFVNPSEFKSQTWKDVGFDAGFTQSQDKTTWLIADDNPNELQRLWNRAVARGRLGGIVADIETGSVNDIDIEDIAYYNFILQRDAPKDEDWLAANVDEHPIGSFILDIIRVLPESLVSSVATLEPGLAGAAAGAGAGALTGGFGAVPGALGGFFGASSLASEYANSMMASFQEAGVDVTNEDELRAVLRPETFEDEEKLANAREYGLARGIPIGILDGIAAGTAGRFVKAATVAGKSVPRAMAKEALVQGALGSGGELSGQILSGDPIQAREILLEGFAELGPAAPGIAYNMVKAKGMSVSERDYATWAQSQNQRTLSATTPIAMAANDGAISRIDADIRELQRGLSNQTDPVVRDATKKSLAELRQKKYELLLETQKDLVSLSQEAMQEASGLTTEILAGADAIRNGNLSPSEQVAVENQMNEQGARLTELINQQRQKTGAQTVTPDDTKEGQQVPGGEPVGTEPGGVPQPRTSSAQTQAGGILQAREAEQATGVTRHAAPQAKPRAPRTISNTVSRARKAHKSKGFLNLFDSYDATIARELMDTMTPGQRMVMDKLILASEAYRKLNPDATHFNVGFGTKGYKNAGKDAGFRDVSGTAGITAATRGGRKPGKILALNFDLKQKESKTGRGYSDRYTPVGTAYHEVMHNVFSTYFDKNPVDFNQFRKLVIRRLKESDAKELNDFANQYEEREMVSAGAYRSEEFMVQLGALLANQRVEFSPSLLEGMKAFLNSIVSKITGGSVQIFEDAALAKDIAAYMEGIGQAIRTGSDISQVKMSERLQSERFKRAEATVEFDEDGNVIGGEESRNLAGQPEPESYERQLDPLEKMMSVLNPKLSEMGARLEKLFGMERLRDYNRKILQALEVSESMNIQHINRMFLALQRIRKAMKPLSEEQRTRAYELSDTFLYAEDKGARDAAAQELVNSFPEIAKDLSVLAAIRTSLQENMVNSPAFDILNEDLRTTIKDSAGKYGTRTYRLFTDAAFKVDPELRKAAEKALVEGYIFEEANNLYEEGITDEQEQEMISMGLDPEDIDSYIMLVESDKKLIFKIKKKVQDKLRTLESLSAAKRGQAGGLTGDPSLGQLRVPTKQFRQKKDLPIELRKMMGEETDPFVRFSHTVSNLANITSQYTLVNRINEIAQLSGMSNLIITKSFWRGLEENTLNLRQLDDIGKQMGLIPATSSINAWMTENGYGTKDEAALALLDYFRENYTKIAEPKSPMNGKAVRNDFVSQLKLTPMYQSDSKFWQGYYNLLLQMRRVRVLYNLPTWRKNIMGGWYFLTANGVMPYNEERGGFTIIQDLRNRFKKMKEGELDPEMEVVLDKMGALGLLGASPNYGMLGDINQSYYDMMTGVDPNDAWGWLPQQMQKAQRELSVRQARIAYQYGFIDDYTKMIAYLSKRENFAKRLASNPDGRSYSQLNPAEQQEVDLAVSERIKQNMPTMSRIHPSFRQLFKLPMGDFLSFRVEAFRSFYSIYDNAAKDIREAMTNENLSESQRKAYLLDGVKALSMGIGMASLSTAGYAALTGMLLDDDDERELAEQVRGVNYLLPAWMVGSNILAADMSENGKIRFINISSEDPYDEMQGLIYGRKGVSKNDAIASILKDFTNPNLAMGMLFNLLQGRNSYGQPIVNNQDANWFNRWVVGSTLSDWSNAYGSYVFKETFLPPNINYIAREYRKRMKQAEENPDIELQPLETAAELSTAVIFRDYPVDIAKQFYYNMEEQNFRTPYVDLNEGEKGNRQARLDEIKEAYNFVSNYAAKFNNFELTRNVINTIENKFSNSPAEKMYILYDIDLPD
jgi:hypothetical protein